MLSIEVSFPNERVLLILPELDPNYDPEVANLIRSIEHSFGKEKPKKPETEASASCFSPAQVGLQFSCGHCMKKALAYGEKASLVYKFDLNWHRALALEWVKIRGADTIIVTTYCDGKAVDHQVVQELTVTGNYHCNGETGIIELNPDSPENAGLSKKVFEIQCGAVCKKVSNVDFVFDGGELLSLFPPAGQSLIIQAFASGKLFNKQCVQQVIVEKKKIVSQENRAVQILP